MNIQHINIKLFVENQAAVKLAEYAAVFNTWIQKQRLEELLIDVADYLHVHNGPGIMLIGHEADYSLDNRAGRLGLLYNRKDQLDGTTQEKLAQAVRALLIVAQILEKENGLKFNGQEVQIVINDRLLVPNTVETFATLESDLREFFNGLYSDAEYSLTQNADPRERFTVNVKTAANYDVETLLKNLSVETAHAYETNGIVYIVGGGPGDPGLITVKGLNCLRQADVVLYDRLAARELLDEVPVHAELIDVGKEPKRHRRSQAEINALLIEKARDGKTVVRLKGGDPFVFGRGGEECQALAEAGIRYEVIPGISSAIAVPAYAGIPVTQRGVATAFTVVAGHTGGSESDIDWDGISRIGTIVFLMGVEHLPEIVAKLIAHGRSSDTPAALIQEGATQNQTVVTGTLEDIVEKAEGICPPAVFVVGEVVRLREQIDWFTSEAFSRKERQVEILSL